MNKSVRSFLVLVLVVWILFGTISLSTVRNPYEFIIPFILLLLPFLLLLFYLSLFLVKDSTSWHKIIAWTGFFVGIASVVVCTATFIWDLIR